MFIEGFSLMQKVQKGNSIKKREKNFQQSFLDRNYNFILRENT